MKVGPGLLVVLVLECSTVCLGAGAKNIFDDDWTPPKKSETRPPATAKPPTPPAQTPSKSTPTTSVPPQVAPDKVTPEKVVPATPAAPAAARLPVPGKAEQAAVRKVMKEVFADQLADRSIAARRKLAAALLGQAEKSTDAPTDQFVLLAAAIDAAEEGVDLPAACAAADRMAELFNVDGLGVKAAAAITMGPRSGVPDAAAGNVESALDLSRELAREDDYVTAARVCAALQPAAARDAGLRAQLQQRQRELVAAREAAERFERDVARLKSRPDDPNANFSVGRYTCLVKGDWDDGLPMLAKGSNAAFKALAERELAHASDPDEVSAVADGWWDAAGKEADATSRAALTAHAVGLYERAVGGAVGLRKVQMEKRIVEGNRAAASAGSRGGNKRVVVDLLKLIDPTRDSVNGTWSLNAAGLTAAKGREVRLAVPYDPPEEYDYHVAFTRHEGKETVQAMFSGNGHSAWLVLWGDSKINFGVQKVDNQERWANSTTGKLDTVFENGKRYDCVIQVRKDSVTAMLDGQQLFKLKTDFSNLQEGGHWGLRGGKLGVGTHENSVTFDTVDITEVTGNGKPTAATPAGR